MSVWTTDDDRDEEPTENYTLSIASPTNATINDALGQGVINDNDDPPELFIDDIVITEGDSGSFAVTISALSDRDVTVQYRTYDGANGAVSLNAYQPGDYTALSLSTLTIPAGQLSRAIWVETVEDLFDESDYEDFLLSLSSPMNASINDGLGLGQIADDEGAPLIYISDLSVNEGETAHMQVSLSGLSAFDVVFSYQTYDVSALTADGDYTGVTASWTISSGELTTAVPVVTLEDALDEDDETLLVSLSSVQNANVGDGLSTLTILDDDATPEIYVSDALALEGETLNFSISLDVVSGRDVVFERRTYDATAVSPADFTALATATLTIPKGVLSIPVEVVSIEDLIFEGDETFTLSITSIVNAIVGDDFGTGTIDDDETQPELYVTDASAVTEGQSSVFTVTLAEVSGLDVTFDYQTYDGTAVSTQDYASRSGSATIFAGQLGITIQISSVDDNRDEEDSEVFTLSIANSVNAVIVDAIGDGFINDNDSPPLIYVMDGSYDESLDSSVVVTISALSDREITFQATSYNGSAVAPGDYTAIASLSGTIPAGSLSFTYTVVVDDDTVYEADETYTVSLSNLVNSAAGDDLATITIENNDTAPTLAVYDLSIPEGETGSFVASLSALSEVPVVFTWATSDITAISASDEDYQGLAAVQVTIPSLTASIQLDVVTTEDLLNEGDETFLVTLYGLTGATFSDASAIGTISDDDAAPQISIFDVAVTEGGVLEFIVSLSAVSGLAITVDYQSYDGTALVGDSDYTGISGQLTIPALMGQMTLAVSTGSDTKYEIDETLTVSLASPVNATILDGNATGTIENDDTVPVLSVADVVITEGETAGFIATLSAVSGVDVVFNWLSVDGTALRPDDYTEIASTQVTILAGSTFIALQVDTIDDALDESSEAFTITLTGITGASPTSTGAEATLNDNDDPPTLAIDDIVIAEGNSGVFTVTLSAVSGLDVGFSYRTYDGANGAVTLNAVAPGDYDAISLTAVTIPAGQSSFTISVNTQDDALDEADYEEFTLSLSAPVNSTILDPVGIAQISDDEGPPQIFIGDFTSDEGGNEVIAITISGLSAVDVVFNYQTYDGTATSGENDYTSKSGQLTIPSGSLTTSVSIASNDDSLDEDDETFTVSLSSIVGAVVGDDVGLVTLLDNDNLPELYISDSTVTEGTSLSFTVSLNVISGRDVTVQRMTYDGSALEPGDYTELVLSTITILKGDLSTIVLVETIDDSVNENQEAMIVSLSSAGNASLVDAIGSGTINDNDPDPTIYVTDSTVTEGTSLEFLITLNTVSEVDVVFDALTYEGAAIEPEDFIATAMSNITIPAGSISYSVWVETVDDAINESQEVMTLSLANVQDAQAGDFVGTGTIDDNEPLPGLYVTDASAVTEGQSTVFVVTLSAVSGLDVSFDFQTHDDTAVSTQDYSAYSSSATIYAGQSGVTIQVATTDDARDEVSSEYFTLSIASAVNSSIIDAVGDGEILDNDSAPFIFISDASELEGSTLYFTVTISALSDLNVDFIAQSFDGTADGADYSAISLASQIPAGSLGITISVNSTEDDIYETDETFTVSLLSIVNASVQTPGDESGTGTIQNDEALPQIFISNATVNEGDTASLLVTISGRNQADVIFVYETADDTALAVSDYTAHALTTVTIPGGSLSHTIQMVTTEDSVYESIEEFFVNVSALSGVSGDPQGTVNIIDDDGMPEIFVSDAGAVTEGETSQFIITLSALTSFDVSFTYLTYDGTATNAQDYTAISGTATILANTLAITLSVWTTDDDLDEEPTEAFTLSIASPTNATINDALGTGTINDNDLAPNLFVSDAATIIEGQSSVFVVTLSAISGLDVSFNFTTNDDTAVSTQDYSSYSGSITIFAGQGGVTIQVSTIDDAMDEISPEYFTLSISSPINSGIAQATGDGAIDDNDNAPLIYISDASGLEGTTLEFNVTLSSASDLNIEFVYMTYDGIGSNKAEEANEDYEYFGGVTVQIPAGTISHAILVESFDDSDYEQDEVFLVSLLSLANVAEGDLLGEGTILNNDYIPFVWMGWAGDGQWTNASNWSTSVVPGASDTAIFNDMCVNCGATINSSVHVGGITIASSFTGAITQASGSAITIGTNGFHMGAGSFVGSSSDMFIDGSWLLQSGSFIAPSGTLEITGMLSIASPVTYSHNSGHLMLSGTQSVSFYDKGVSHGRVSFVKDTTAGAVTVSIVRSTHFSVNGDLMFDTIGTNEMVVTASPNQIIQYEGSNAYVLGHARTGTLGLYKSSGALTITAVDTAVVGNLNIGSSANIDFNGTFNICSGITVQAGGIINTTGTLIRAISLPSTTCSGTYSIGAANSLDHFEFNRTKSFENVGVSGEFNVTGSLTINNTASGQITNTGVIKASGDVSMLAGNGGTALIEFTGSDTQVISQSGGTWPPGAITVNKAGGSIELASNVTFGAAQDMEFTAGTINMNGYNLGIQDILNMSSGTTIDTGCGTLTYNVGSSTINGTIISGVSTPNMTISDASANEGSTLAFTVSLDAPRCGGNVTVNYASSSGTATSSTDFTAVSGTLTFAPGQTVKTINVVTTQDATSEGNETLTVSLSSIANGTLVDSVGVGTIINDDLAPFTWTGLGADSNWTTAANWSTTVVPGASDTAIFNNLCTQCDATVNANVSVGGVWLYNGFSGSITQSSGFNINVGNSSWIQEDGEFYGSNGNLILTDGSLSVVGGVFNAPSANLNILRGHLFLEASSFVHGGGSIMIEGSNSTYNLNWPGVEFNNLNVAGWATSYNVVGHAVVHGLFTNKETYSNYYSLNGGGVEARGDIHLENYLRSGSFVVSITGSGNQTMEGFNADSGIGHIRIAKTSGTLTIVGSSRVNGSWEHITGDVDASGSYLRFGPREDNYTVTIATNGMSFGNVEIFGNGADHIFNSSITVNNLLLAQTSSGTQMIGGIVDVKGDMSCIDQGPYFNSTITTVLRVSGEGTQNISSTGTSCGYPHIVIEKSSGQLNFGSRVNLRRGIEYVSGEVGVGGSNVHFFSIENTPVDIDIGAITLNNVHVEGPNSIYNLKSDVNVSGDLSVSFESSDLVGYGFNVFGDVSIASTSYGRNISSALRLVGTSNTSIHGCSGSCQIGFQPVVINKASADVSLLGHLELDRQNQDLTVQSGTLNMNGYNLTVSDSVLTDNVLTLESGTVINTGCGTLTYETLVNNGGAINSGSVSPNMTIFDVSSEEGTTLAYTVSLDAPRCGGNVTVNYASSSGTATSGTDFTAVSGTLTFAPGETIKSINVVSAEDTAAEGNETLMVSLSSIANGTLVDTVGVGTIVNDDTDPYMWTGNAWPDTNWSNGANWFNGVNPPNSTQTAIFNNLCTYCDAVMNAAIIVGGIRMDAGFSGTITQAPGVSVQVNSGGFLQGSGSFFGDSSPVSITGALSVVGGVHRLTSGRTTLGGNTTFSNADLQHNGGFVFVYAPDRTLNFGSITLNNLTFDGVGWSAYNLMGTDMTVLGALTVHSYVGCLQSCSLNNGVIHAKGNVYSTGDGKYGSTVIRLDGSSNQTIQSLTTTSRFPSVVIASTGGQVNLGSTVRIQGLLFEYVSGNVNIGSSHVIFDSDTNGIMNKAIKPGTLVFDDVTLFTEEDWVDFTLTGDLSVAGNLILGGCGAQCEIFGDDVVALGNVQVVDNGFASGSSFLRMAGSGLQVLDFSLATQGNIQSLDIASSGTVSIVGTGVINKNYQYTSGSVVGSSYWLDFFSPKTINAGLVEYLNVKFTSPSWGSYGLSGGRLIVDQVADLSSSCTSCTLNSGTLEVQGSLLALGSGGFDGTATVEFTTSEPGGLSIVSGARVPDGLWTINKPSGTLTMYGALSLSASGQDLTVQSGTLNMNGHNLWVSNSSGTDNVLTVNAGATIFTGCGTITAESIVNNGTIIYGSETNLTVGDVTVNEPDGNANVVVSLSASNCTPTIMTYVTMDQTALAGQDYTAVSGSATIASGSLAVTISVPILNDLTYEPGADETFLVSLGGITVANVVDNVAVVSIVNDDLPPAVITISAPTPSLPAALDYQSTFDSSVTLTNTGGQSATAMAISLAHPAFTDLGTGDCGASLAQNSSCTMSLRFTSLGESGYGTTFKTYYNDGYGVTLASRDFVAGGAALSISVGAAYANGTNWNDYIKNDGADPYSASGTACAGTENGALSCLHGGEMRSVSISTTSSCSSLSATDALDAFDWKCFKSGGVATFKSYTLKSGKRLADLISHGNPNGSWANNSVTIYDGAYIAGESASGGWWSNTIKALPSNSGLGVSVLPNGGDSGNTIYTAGGGGDVLTDGYNLNADKLAIVVMPGTVLKWSGTTASSVTTADGESSGANNLKAVLGGGGQKHLWVEGEFNGLTGGVYASDLIYLHSVKLSRFGDLKLNQIENNGLRMISSDSNLIKKMSAQNGLWARTLHIEGGFNASYEVVSKGVGSSCCSTDFRIHTQGVGNLMQAVHLSEGNAASGLRMYGDGSDLSIIVQAHVANVAYDGIANTDGDYGTLSHLTALNSAGRGVNVGDWSNVSQVLSANNGAEGIRLDEGNSGTGSQMANVASLHNAGYGLIASGSQSKFKGVLMMGGNALDNCDVPSGTNVGVDDVTCTTTGLDGSSVYTSTLSSAVLRTGRSVANSFKGQMSGDYINTTAGALTTGLLAKSGVTDWMNFEQLFWQSFGRAVTVAFPEAGQRGSCRQLDANCQMWDWRLDISDTVVRNKSGDGSNSNSAFTEGSACPSAVNGNVALTDFSREVLNDGVGDDDYVCEGGESCTNSSYLINAIEIAHDGIGNDNGLCESNEACVYSPNFGAYQGEGELTKNTCTFNANGGPVSGVQMYAWSINGTGDSGTMDTTFSGNGWLSLNPSAGQDIAYDVVELEDGKLLVGGYATVGGKTEFMASRVTRDGVLDTSYGSSGYANVSFSEEAMAYGIALQRDGKAILAGFARQSGKQRMAMVRLNSNGTLDTEFGDQGIIVLSLSAVGDQFVDVLIQPDGKIIGVGSINGTDTSSCSDIRFALVRFNPDGSLDSTFGSGNGYVTTDVNGTCIPDTGEVGVLTPDGKIMVGGQSGYGGSYSAALARYNSDGSLDTSFSGDGKMILTHPASNNTKANDIKIQADGKIVILHLTNSSSADFAISRLNSDGTMDTSFDSDGFAQNVGITGYNGGTGLFILDDGRILAAGRKSNSSDLLYVSRFTASGQLDPSFGSNVGVPGFKSLAPTTSLYMNRAILTRDGRIIMVGNDYSTSARIFKIWN